MSIDMIQQHARMLKHAAPLYEKALQTNNTKELNNLKSYAHKLALNIKKALQEELENVL